MFTLDTQLDILTAVLSTQSVNSRQWPLTSFNDVTVLLLLVNGQLVFKEFSIEINTAVYGGIISCAQTYVIALRQVALQVLVMQLTGDYAGRE